MPVNPFPYSISPDPRYLLLIAIATPNRIETLQLDLHLLEYIQLDEWSLPQPVPDQPEKIMVVLNRLMVTPPPQRR